jgi:hypothetical protein
VSIDMPAWFMMKDVRLGILSHAVASVYIPAVTRQWSLTLLLTVGRQPSNVATGVEQDPEKDGMASGQGDIHKPAQTSTDSHASTIRRASSEP